MNYSISIGYHGESVIYNSRLTTAIKSHGNTIDGASLGSQPEMIRPFARTNDQMMCTNGNGILLIRNPYKAIYGNRHLNDGGHIGYADASKFFGRGTESNNF